jgi:hypothetical protein
MAITINGTGSITGLTAGGLPDGSVTAADIETSLDLTGKTVTLPSGTGGKIINSAVYRNDTRTSLANAGTTRVDLMSVSFNKQLSSSDLVFFGTIPGHKDESGHLSQGFTYGTTVKTGGWVFQYGAVGEYARLITIGGYLTGHTTTGAQDFKIQYFCVTSTSRPFLVMNPNGTDDSRLNQQESQLVILEVAS